jgi:uncharacterized membrane protein YkoI
MKKMSLLLTTLNLSLISCAQNVAPGNVPALVVNTFQQQFPKAADIEWKKKGNLYEVEFETGLSGKDHKMLIDSLGKITYHKFDISESELPDAIRKTITTQFSGYTEDDPEKVESDGLVTYEVELKKKPEEWEVTFSSDGKILGKLTE